MFMLKECLNLLYLAIEEKERCIFTRSVPIRLLAFSAEKRDECSFRSSITLLIDQKGHCRGKAGGPTRLRPNIAPPSTFYFFVAYNTGDKRENKLSAAAAASPLYILHITTEGTMCLRWQVAIVHNVLMLTKCHFDPWRTASGAAGRTS